MLRSNDRRHGVRGTRRSRGQILVEFCLCLPLLIIILIAVIDMGFLLWKENVITVAVRDGVILGTRLARTQADWVANLGPNEAAIRTYMSTVVQGTGLAPGEITITTLPLDPNVGNYDSIEVRVQHNHVFFFPLNFTGGPTLTIDRRYRAAFLFNTAGATAK